MAWKPKFTLMKRQVRDTSRLVLSRMRLKKGVEDELERLEKEGIISPVEFSEWAAPIVPVVKTNGDVRICIKDCFNTIVYHSEFHPLLESSNELSKTCCRASNMLS